MDRFDKRGGMFARGYDRASDNTVHPTSQGKRNTVIIDTFMYIAHQICNCVNRQIRSL